jgi:hypothetical protein
VIVRANALPMSVEDFRRATKAYRRFEIMSGGALFALLCGASFATLFVVKRIDHAGLDTTSIVLLAVSYPMIAVLMFWVMARLPQRWLRERGLTCPACKARLIGSKSRAVVATGHCGVCGHQVLEGT